MEGLAAQGREHGINTEASADANIRSLQHTVLYGLKGVAAYAFHAAVLGYRDPVVDNYFVEALVDLARYDEGDLNAWIGKALRCGEINYKTMELLDKANTETFGTPVPTEVPLGVKAGKAILVSGHDLLDLEALLKQTEGKGITVYTHGEMLPAHALSQAQGLPPSLRQLRHRLAEPEEGVRRVPRRHPDDHQLHPASPGRPTSTTSSPAPRWGGPG